jgi:hypothetical protein
MMALGMEGFGHGVYAWMKMSGLVGLSHAVDGNLAGVLLSVGGFGWNGKLS